MSVAYWVATPSSKKAIHPALQGLFGHIGYPWCRKEAGVAVWTIMDPINEGSRRPYGHDIYLPISILCAG